MDFFFLILIILLLGSILVSSIWNVLLFRRIKKEISLHQKITDKENYIEMKYKIQFFTSIFAIFIFIIGFFGYNSKENFKKEIQNEIQTKISDFKLSFDSLNTKKDSLIFDFISINDTVKKIKKDVNMISTKNILKPEIYIVKNIPIKSGDKSQIFYFKNMLTITNDKIPKLKKRPVISIGSPEGTIPSIKNITEDYIEFNGTVYYGDKREFYYLDLWIAIYNK